MPSITIRKAVIDDASLILNFVTELAIYEKAEHEVIANVDDVKESLFSADATAQAIICSVNDQPIGFAVYFFSYSTWLGRRGLYLEDLYVASDYRGLGAGKALLKHLAEIALSTHCGRFEWRVLDWNESAITFYESIGAKPQQEWVGYRLAGKALEAFANS